MNSPLQQEAFSPDLVIIDNYRSCNAACRMCPTQQKSYPNPRMSDAVFDALLPQLASIKGSLKQVLFGVHGEPLLDKGIEDRVAAIRTAGISNVHINTNGAALIPKRVEKLIEAGVSGITISIDGIDAATFEAIRVGLNFQNVLKNIRQCVTIRDQRQSTMQIVIRCIVQSLNHASIPEWEQFWQNQLNPSLDGIEIIPVHNWAYSETAEMDLSTSCSNVFTSMIVSYDGSIPLCCMDHESHYNFGNVQQAHIMDIFNNAAYNDLRAMHESGRRGELDLCKTCDRPETRAIVEADSNYLVEREKVFDWKRGA